MHRCFDRRRALDGRRHAAEHEARVADALAVERTRKRRTPRRCRCRSAWRSCRRAADAVERRQRHLDRLHELAGLEPVLHVVGVEVGQRQAARAARRGAAAAARRARSAPARCRRSASRWRRCRPSCPRGGSAARRSAATLRSARAALRQRAPRRPRATRRRRCAARRRAPSMRLQLGHFADVDDVAQIAELLVDPQADVGGAGEQPRLRCATRSAASAVSVRGARKRSLRPAPAALGAA